MLVYLGLIMSFIGFSLLGFAHLKRANIDDDIIFGITFVCLFFGLAFLVGAGSAYATLHNGSCMCP